MKKKVIYAAMLLSLIISLTVPALAEGGNGDGTGGAGQALSLSDSSVPNGAAGVALDAGLTLTFSKNVVNMTAKDNNLACFSMMDGSGNAVPITVLMGDDQADPTIKRIVDIQPKSPLKPDTKYTLTVSKNLTAKSGGTMVSDVTLNFTTVGAPAPAVSASASPSAPVSTGAAAGMGIILWLITGGVTVILVMALVIARYIRKKNSK